MTHTHSTNGHPDIHSHEHQGHNHSHTTNNYGRAFVVGISLNIVFIIAEVIYGLKANSLALLADAGHNSSDVLGLVVAWVAVWLTKKKPNTRYTYGLQSSSILAALANALFLLVAIGGIAWEAFQRFGHTENVAENTVMAVATLGIFVNGFTAFLFMKGSKNDLNIRGAFLHMATDAAVSLGVVISGFLMLKTGWMWIDPAISITIAAIIIIGTWGLLRDSLNLALHAVPSHIQHEKVKEFLVQVPGVKEVHDLHIWGMSTTQVALSAHLVIPNGHPGDTFLSEIADKLHDHFGIEHSTIQVEIGDGKRECALASDNVV